MKCRPILSAVKKRNGIRRQRNSFKKERKAFNIRRENMFSLETGSKRSKTRSFLFFKHDLPTNSQILTRAPPPPTPFFNDNAASGLSIWWQSTSRGLLQSSGKEEKTNKSPNLHYSKPAHSPCHSLIFFKKKLWYILTGKPFNDAPRSATYRECYHSKRYAR